MRTPVRGFVSLRPRLYGKEPTSRLESGDVDDEGAHRGVSCAGHFHFRPRDRWPRVNERSGGGVGGGRPSSRERSRSEPFARHGGADLRQQAIDGSPFGSEPPLSPLSPSGTLFEWGRGARLIHPRSFLPQQSNNSPRTECRIGSRSIRLVVDISGACIQTGRLSGAHDSEQTT
ncbi:hypothetical protein MRX96_058357 [Rhipicephalus microplus]